MAELDKFKRRVIRSVARMLLAEKRPEPELWEVLKAETGCDCRKLWERMRGLTLKKLKRLLAAEDKTDHISPIAKMSLTDWLLFDLVLVHDDIEVIGEDTPATTIPKPLEDLFDIVDEFEIEGKVGEALADAWTAATFAYNKMGRQCSPMLLQRRWYQMKRKARSCFYKLWYTYRGNSRLLVNAKSMMPNKLEVAIAQRYPHVVTKPFPEWNHMIENKSVILPEEFEKKINPSSQLPANKGDIVEPDIVLLEPNIETIDLGDADSEPDDNEEGADVAKKTVDFNIESAIKEVVIKTEPLDDIQTYSESLDDSLREINKRLLESVPNIDDDEEDANFNMETDNLAETPISNDFISTTTENVTIENTNANTENDITNVDAVNKPVILTTNQISDNENENTISETGTEDISNIIKTENDITVDHTESYIHENSNSENNLTEELQQTVSSDVNDIYVETVATDEQEISEPMVMPQITNVFGNVNVATDVLIKMSNMSREAKEINQSPNPVLTTIDNVQSEPIDVADDDDEVNAKLEAYLNSSKITEQETEPVDLNVVNQGSTQLEQESSKTDDINSFLDTTVDLTFADDGIELVDDDIEYEEDDDDDIIKPIGETHLKQELDTAVKLETDSDIKSETVNKESDEREVNTKFDLKLLMQPVVYTTKLEDMKVFRDLNVDCVSDTKLLDDALIESKPISKAQYNIEKENEEMFNTSLSLTSDDDKNCDDSLTEDEMSEPEELPIDKRVKLSSYVLQKPKSRSYNPIQLCKNPDFNTRLKRLTACFLSSMRNRLFLKTLKPMTIDVSKAFESKLIGGTMYLESESVDFTPLNEEAKDNSEQAVSNLPSAMPVQRLIDNLIGQSTFRSTTSEPNACPKPSQDSTDLPERSKVINLPDLDNIRRMNQRLFTAEITPMRIQGPNEKCIPPVQLVKFGTEDPVNRSTGHTLNTAEDVNYNLNLPMHTGIVNETLIGEKFTVNVGSGKQKPGPKSRCGMNYKSTTFHQMNSTDTQKQFNAESLEKNRCIVDNADTQNSDPKQLFNIDNIRTTEITSNRCTPLIQPEKKKTGPKRHIVDNVDTQHSAPKQKPGPKRDDIFKPKKLSYYPASRNDVKNISNMSWLKRGFFYKEAPVSSADEALLTLDTLNKMLSLMEDKEPILMNMKKMRAMERKRHAQRQNELDSRLDEYEKRKLGPVENEKSKPDQLENKEGDSNEKASNAKKIKNVEPIYETSLAQKPKILTLSFCCWARSKIEYPRNKRRHRCPRICECCCRNELLVKTKRKSAPTPSSIVISDEEDNTASDSITGAIESVVQQSRVLNVTSENSETLNDSNNIASVAKVTTSSQQVEASVQCDLDDNNWASQQATSIETDINEVSSKPPSVSTDVISIGDNEDKDKNEEPKAICQPVVNPTRPIIIKKPRITVLTPVPIKPKIKTYVPIEKKKKQQAYAPNYVRKKSTKKLIYFNTKENIESDRGCPIYLGKDKILLTDVKFPSDLISAESPVVTPFLDAAKPPAEVAAPAVPAAVAPPTYNLPEGVQIVLQPDGKVNCIVDPFAKIPTETLQTLPALIKVIQQQIDATTSISGEVINVDDDDNNKEVAESIVSEKSDSFHNVNLLNNETLSVVGEDNEVTTNDTIKITPSIKNNITLECNEMLNDDDTNMLSYSDSINKQSLSTSQDNEAINPTPGENFTDCGDSLFKTFEQSNIPTTSQAIEESKATSEITSIDRVVNAPETLEQSNIPTTSQAIEESNATSEITSIVRVDNVHETLEQCNKITMSQAMEESKATSEITSSPLCVDNAPETLEQSNDQTASQAMETSNPITSESSVDIVVTSSETREQYNVPVENSDAGRSLRSEMDITENQESKIDKTVPNKNRSTLLSDLMEMSGISAEDTTLPPNENIGINIPMPPLMSLAQQVSPSYLQTAANATPFLKLSPIKIMPGLSSIVSFKQLKYACEHNGNFFKLDLDTGNFSKINVHIQSTLQPGQSSSVSQAVIDLTEDPTLPVDEALSERPAMSKTQNLRVNSARPAIRVRKSLSSTDNNSEPQAFVILKSNPTKSLLKDSYHLANSAKPLKLFRSANFIKHNQENKVSSTPTDSHLQDSAAKGKRKQKFDDNSRLDAESLNSDDSFDSIDDYIWSTDKYLSGSDSSDDEPLAVKAKRMKYLETKESSDIASNSSSKVIQPTVDNIQNTADENIVDPEEGRENGSEMNREITFMSDHEGDDGNEDCILGV